MMNSDMLASNTSDAYGAGAREEASGMLGCYCDYDLLESEYPDVGYFEYYRHASAFAFA